MARLLANTGGHGYAGDLAGDSADRVLALLTRLRWAADCALTPDERAHIKAREAAATAGPWTWQSQTIGEHPRTLDDGKRDLCSPGGPVVYYSQSTIWCSDADAAFIAAARTDVPALVTEVERLTAELANAHDVIEALRRNLNAAGDEIDLLHATIDENRKYLRQVLEQRDAGLLP